ncbi:hypothetical protein BKA61DRAFT_635211 [Leptodontidium sp. MPI-SDFR-AT-0119]|nr:hypothetical protein BKA61DRAFT_635211 [Leptodontidium sp. MPI-SDFR-AT-0119]
MRLLYYNSDGDFSMAKFFKSAIPESPFEDLQNGTGTKKAGYEKIRFCAEQAKRDGLQYFGVDTCCIDKSNSAELVEAINSMFRWYRMSTKCYVYLLDVSRTSVNINNLAWELPFRKSKWFARGWALQELITPTLIKFFYRESKRTKVHEDKAYLLLGIFDVRMPLRYSEGIAKGWQMHSNDSKRKSTSLTSASKTYAHADDAFRSSDSLIGLLKFPQPPEIVLASRCGFCRTQVKRGLWTKWRP